MKRFNYLDIFFIAVLMGGFFAGCSLNRAKDESIAIARQFIDLRNNEDYEKIYIELMGEALKENISQYEFTQSMKKINGLFGKPEHIKPIYIKYQTIPNSTAFVVYLTLESTYANVVADERFAVLIRSNTVAIDSYDVDYFWKDKITQP